MPQPKKLKTLVELEFNECRYIDPVHERNEGGDFLFCAEIVTGPSSSWCAHHEKICFGPAYQRTKLPSFKGPAILR